MISQGGEEWIFDLTRSLANLHDIGRNEVKALKAERDKQANEIAQLKTKLEQRANDTELRYYW